MDKKKKILVIMGRYLPGYKDGGPVRSIKNLTDYLGGEYDIRILTCDRDHGDEQTYPNIKVNGWNEVGNAMVYYVPPKGFTCKVIKQLASEVDLVYVCGCYSDYAIKTLLLKRFGKIKKNVVVAAMGLFSPKVFQLKSLKHKTFITICNLAGVFRNVYWSATSTSEVTNIKKQIWTKDEQVYVAEDLPRLVDATSVTKSKKEGHLRVVWISRISHEKNLLQAISILANVKAKIEFTIYGPQHDLEYWQMCKNALNVLPKNIQWTWEGAINSEEVVQILKEHHVFLFPTFGENYGHVIQEALSAGCAVIVSNQTMWKNLEQCGVGYVFSLDEQQKYMDAIEKYAGMSEEQLQNVADKALNYAIDHSIQKAKDTGYRKLFDDL